MRRGQSIFWGTVLLLGAAAMIMGRLGYLEGIGFWNILFSACLIALLMKGLARRRIGTILFSAAFLIIVNDRLLHLEAITPWPVLGAALLGTMGLKILFPGLGRKRRGSGRLVREGGEGEAVLICQEGGSGMETEVCDLDGSCLAYENVFGSSVKYVTGVVNHVDIDNVFGSMEVYFTEALLGRGEARVEVDAVFGSVVLYVPRTWQVELNTDNVAASSNHKGKYSPDGRNVIYVEGDIVFGSLEVISV